MTKLSPSRADLPLRGKLWNAIGLFRYHVGLRRMRPYAVTALDDIDAYRALLATYSGLALERARVLEIGYGARPWRLLALLSTGADALGVDAEVPVLEGHAWEYREALRRNGVERALKSFVRHTVFDRRDRRAFRAELRRRGLRERIDRSRFLVGDAADLALPPGSLDLVISEEVFEHVRRESLARLVPKLARWLRPEGLALIRPNVFTGITGGHHPEWYRYTFQLHRRRRWTEPWEHLRRDRMRPDTYLNRLTRAQYRALLETSFEILEEMVAVPDLGRELLTPSVAAELAAYPDEELFSNQVLFVMRPRGRARE